MSIQRPLKFGVAYHGNRFLSHAMDDMRKIAAADMDIVVHMFSHNDWERHDTVMGDMFKMTEAIGHAYDNDFDADCNVCGLDKDAFEVEE